MNKVKIIYLFPNVMTITYVFAGLLSIHASIQGKYSLAALLIVVAAVLDALDGIIARATNTQSDFGEGLDSLADSFAFGASSSFLIYFWGLRNAVYSHALIISFMFLAASILRLASYAILPRITSDRKYYLGLTVPSSSALLAGVVICHPNPLEGGIPTFFLAILAILLSLLMVSNLKYRNLFQFNFHRTTNMFAALSATIIISACILYPLCFLLFALLYVLSGPVKLVLGFFFKQTIVEKQR
jgi:CDP-diacylglycerol--serine O-phosphatidyltransferase